MNYQETIQYLFSQLPIYQRIGEAAYKANLDNTIALCNFLKNPEKKFKSIHVAGTNGKGSVTHILASIFQEMGYKTGLYTSPHFLDFRERIKINGEIISENFVVKFVEENKSNFEKIQPSFFEMTVAMCFDYFAKEKVDIAIIETGLGGRLDSTNVIVPELSIITNISFDHINLLGNTIEKIAFEKAGIIKEKIPVVIGNTYEKAYEVFTKKAQELQSDIYFVENENVTPLQSDLVGDYQIENTKTVHLAVKVLRKKGYSVSEKDLVSGSNNVLRNTGLLGRWQTIGNNPLVVCDMCHNEAGVNYIVNQIKKIKYNKLHIVWGCVNDKLIDDILNLLPKEATYYFCKANIPRGLDANELMLQASKFGIVGLPFPTVKNAFEEAKNSATENDFIFVGGSAFVVAEVL
jgi:dihydrofolate synthase / folylpolyglutamate synthase